MTSTAITFAIGSFLFFLPYFAFAQLEITEVMYDVPGSDSGREWIEVTNTGPGVLDIGKYKLFENGVNHGLKLVQGSSELQPNTSAVIASNAGQFLADHPAYAGTLFDSAFSLSNTGESLAIKDEKGTIVTTKAYVAEKLKATPPPTSKKISAKDTQVENSTPKNSPTAAVAVAENLVPTLPSYLLWLFALAGIILIGVGGILFLQITRKETSLNADEFKIE